MANKIYKIMYKKEMGNVMTDIQGMTLYTYTRDTQGISNCTGVCLVYWPAYAAPSSVGTFPPNISVIKRSDGVLQYAWKGMPLYYSSKDANPQSLVESKIGGFIPINQ